MLRWLPVVFVALWWSLYSAGALAQTEPPPEVTEVDWVALGVTPENILKYFAFGFGSVFFFWSTGYGVAVALGLIRKL